MTHLFPAIKPKIKTVKTLSTINEILNISLFIFFIVFAILSFSSQDLIRVGWRLEIL